MTDRNCGNSDDGLVMSYGRLLKTTVASPGKLITPINTLIFLLFIINKTDAKRSRGPTRRSKAYEISKSSLISDFKQISGDFWSKKWACFGNAHAQYNHLACFRDSNGTAHA